ncbi:MAG TPA: DNA polymerase III subunit delta [Cyclobacteriaceae bacterium]|nr:DNA polymerase III subunit delta [Cyclobacteriaceae bacterium]
MDAAAKQILTDLKSKKYKPVYLLQGEETYYIDLIANYIEKNVLSESEKSFNQVVVYGKDSPVSTILTHARRFPMMAERQVVIVREAQDIPDLQKEQGSKLMLDYATRPVPSTILVLCHMHKTLDKRRELGKKLDSLTESATFKKMYDNQLPAFVEEYVSSKGYSIDDKGVRVMCEFVGNDLNRMVNEIDKVLISAPAGSMLNGDKIMGQVGMSREFNIFELQKALIMKDTFQAARIVNYIASTTKRNPVIPLVAFLYSFFSKLLVASAAKATNERELVTLLKISPFAAKDYSSALNRYHTMSIIQNIGLLKEADLKLKGVNSGSASEGDILKELVFRLMA